MHGGQEKTEKLVQLTAQRNSAKNRADSLAKDLSRVCGGGRTVDQIEAIFTRYFGTLFGRRGGEYVRRVAVVSITPPPSHILIIDPPPPPPFFLL